MSTRPLSGWSAFVKRTEDIVIASVALLVLAPCLILTGLAIKLENTGPTILFRQRRHGMNQIPFEVLKFRTMYEERPPEPGVPQAVRNDPRVTRVGGFLRKTSIDELPQLINVLRGDMSVVGPRPLAIEHGEIYSQHIKEYFWRHRVRPGITGLAQVSDLRGETATPEKRERRVALDLAYVDNWSVALDIKILIKTPFALWGGSVY